MQGCEEAFLGGLGLILQKGGEVVGMGLIFLQGPAAKLWPKIMGNFLLRCLTARIGSSGI